MVEQTLVDRRFPSNGLGNHFLERYHVVIDFPASRLYLSPDPAYKEDPLEWVGTGLTVVRYNNKVLVNCVYAPSSAKSADIAEGDEVISCDGHLLKGMSIEEVTALMQSKRKVGATVTLEIIPISHLPTRTVKLQMKQLL